MLPVVFNILINASGCFCVYIDDSIAGVCFHQLQPDVCKPLFLETPFLRSQTFIQHSQGQDSQPLSDAIEPEEHISQESNITSDDENGFLESPTTHNRIARNAHPCVSKVVRGFDSCRNLWVDKVECKVRHPACNYVIPIHRVPKCHTVYGFRNATFVGKCSALPIDCQCAS